MNWSDRPSNEQKGVDKNRQMNETLEVIVQDDSGGLSYSLNPRPFRTESQSQIARLVSTALASDFAARKLRRP